MTKLSFELNVQNAVQFTPTNNGKVEVSLQPGAHGGFFLTTSEVRQLRNLFTAVLRKASRKR